MATWFDNKLKQGQTPHKTFTGVRPDLQQFICQMRDFPVELAEYLDLMSEALKFENCAAYAHGSRYIKFGEGGNDDIEVVNIFAGQAGDYRVLEFEVSHEGIKFVQEHVSQKPQIFFQELPPEYYKSSQNKNALIELWQKARSHIFWRTWE